MENLPEPMLGNVFAITMGSTDLDRSFEFYQKLGFTEVFRSDWPFPMILISDGALLIVLRKDDNPFLSLTYYVRELDKMVSRLEDEGMEFVFKPAENDMVQRYVMRSPDGLNIALVTLLDGFVQPDGPIMVKMDQKDFFNPEKYVNEVSGMFGELAHPVIDLDASISFWEKLGFKALSKFTNPYPWAIVTDGLSVVGLHQTKNFDYTAITFFAADMANKIERIKSTVIESMTETGKGNAVLITPEKQHVNLFKLGL